MVAQALERDWDRNPIKAIDDAQDLLPLDRRRPFRTVQAARETILELLPLAGKPVPAPAPPPAPEPEEGPKNVQEEPVPEPAEPAQVGPTLEGRLGALVSKLEELVSRPPPEPVIATVVREVEKTVEVERVHDPLSIVGTINTVTEAFRTMPSPDLCRTLLAFADDLNARTEKRKKEHQENTRPLESPPVKGPGYEQQLGALLSRFSGGGMGRVG